MRFTYNAYINLIRNLQEYGYTIYSYKDWNNSSSCALLRHDIDNDIRKALELAKVPVIEESSLGKKDKTAQKDEKVPKKPAFLPGTDVLITSSKMQGSLIREEKKGVWLVQVGSLRMSIKKKDLLPLDSPDTKPSVNYSVELSSEHDEENAVFMKGGATAKPVFELRLLGMREEEAIKLLQRQLDLCSMQNFRTFSVIHGKGQGILQQAVQDYLSTYPGVKEFHFARPEDGGTGKTYVTLI